MCDSLSKLSIYRTPRWISFHSNQGVNLKLIVAFNGILK